MPLREWMTPDPISASPSETVREALMRMRRHRVEALPVTLGGMVMGLLYGPSLLRRALDPARGEVPEDLASRPLADFMVEVEAVSPDTTEEEALARMRQAGIPVLAVVEGARLVGMITESDLFGYLLDRISSGSGRRPAAPAGNHLDVLLRVAREASNSLELSTILQEITRHAMAVLPIDRSALLLLPEPDSPNLLVHSLYSSTEPESDGPERIPVDGTVSGRVTLQRKSLLVDDLDKDERGSRSREIWGMGLRSLLSAPLLFRGECLGVLNFWCRRPYAYLSADLELVEMMAGHISAAVQSARRVESEQRLVEELRQANRIKDEFLAVTTHDMGNALQGVLAYARILKRKTSGMPALEELTGDLHDSASYMASLISDLHDLARLGMRAIRLHRQEVDLQAAIRAVREQHAEMARELGLELRCKEDGAALRLQADPIRLRQILANLLSNALKYNRPGGWVEVRWRQVGDDAIVEVEDSGVGIRPEHRDRIFDLFGRIEGARKVEGSGLGLSITRQLVDLHGGRVELDSEPGVGSTFRIILPMHAPAEGEVGVPAAPPSSG